MNPIPTTTAARSAATSRLIASHSATERLNGPPATPRRNLESAVPSARRDQELLILEPCARVEHNSVGGHINSDNAGPKLLHRLLLIQAEGLTYRASSSSERRYVFDSGD